MSDFKYPLELKSLAPFHPSEIISTGYDVIDLTFINLMMQSEDGYGLAGNPNNDDYLPSKALGQSGSSSITTDGVDFMFYLSVQLLGEGWDWMIKTITNASWTSIADYDVFEFAVKNYRYGLRRRPMWEIQEDGSTTATTNVHRTQSINWDHDGGTLDAHQTYIKRFFYAAGVRDASRFPDLTDSIKDSATQTSWDRISEIMCFGVVMELVYLYVLGALQSDRFVWSLGAAQPGILPRKVESQDLAVSMDPIWIRFTKPLIHDVLGSSMSADNYDGLANAYGAFIFSLVDLSNMDPFNQRLSVNYDVPKSSLGLARKLFGGGLYEVKERGNYERNHFAILLNLAEPAGSTYTTHGISEWALGPNTAIGIDFLEDLRRIKYDFESLLNKKHWTWFDVRAVFKDFWTDFNVVKSISGFCDPRVYKAIRRQFNHSDSVKTFSDGLGYYSGGNQSSTEADQYTGGAWVSSFDHENWFHTLFVWPEQDPRDCLYMGSDWDINELLYDLWYQMLFHTDTIGDVHKVYWYRQRYVEIIDFRDGSHFAFASPTSTNDVARFECYGDTLGNGLCQMKYGVWLDEMNTTFSRVYQGSRPKGYVDHHPMRIERYGDPDVKLQLIEAFMALLGATSVEITSNSPVEITETPRDKDNPESKPKPPVSKGGSKEPTGVDPDEEGGGNEDE